VSAVRQHQTFNSNERPERGLRARGAREDSFFYPSLPLYISLVFPCVEGGKYACTCVHQIIECFPAGAF
jgi:hypothetical protein